MLHKYRRWQKHTPNEVPWVRSIGVDARPDGQAACQERSTAWRTQRCWCVVRVFVCHKSVCKCECACLCMSACVCVHTYQLHRTGRASSPLTPCGPGKVFEWWEHRTLQGHSRQRHRPSGSKSLACCCCCCCLSWVAEMMVELPCWLAPLQLTLRCSQATPTSLQAPHILQPLLLAAKLKRTNAIAMSW